MHELSIAQNIVDTVLSEVQKNDAKKVTEISVEVGQLMQLDRNALAFALRLLMTGPVLKGARVHVRVRKASFSCRKCNQEWGMAEAQKQLAKVPDSLRVREPESKELPLHFLPFLYPAFIRCPRCGSSDISSKEGEEMQLRSVVME
ncbi:MAG: hydrogenase maturation nickel metallochaperone HypA [Nitrososphaerales archaeon]